jgi:hypothetical protein
MQGFHQFHPDKHYLICIYDTSIPKTRSQHMPHTHTLNNRHEYGTANDTQQNKFNHAEKVWKWTTGKICTYKYTANRTSLSRNKKSMNSSQSTNWHSSHTHYERVHKQITNRQEHQTRIGKSGLLQIKCITLRTMDIMNIVEIILRNCCITDYIHMRPHTV